MVEIADATQSDSVRAKDQREKEHKEKRIKSILITGITPKRVASGVRPISATWRLRSGQHKFEVTSQWWQAVGDRVRFNRPGNRISSSIAVFL